MSRAQAGVELGIEQVVHGLDADFVFSREPAPGRWHELHESPGAGGGECARVEGALRPDDGVHQIGVRPSGLFAFDDERIDDFPKLPRQVASARAHRIPEGFVDQVNGAVALACRREGARRGVARIWRWAEAAVLLGGEFMKTHGREQRGYFSNPSAFRGRLQPLAVAGFTQGGRFRCARISRARETVERAQGELSVIAVAMPPGAGAVLGEGALSLTPSFRRDGGPVGGG